MLNSNFKNILLPENMIDLIVNFYTNIYVMYKFYKLASELIQSLIIIHILINQFVRYKIRSEVFDLLILNWHIKSLYILANFITDNKKVDCYSS